MSFQNKYHLRGKIIGITWVMYKNMNKGHEYIENPPLPYQTCTPTVILKINLKVDHRAGGKWFIHGPTWWRHQMETFFALLAICAGNSPVPGDFPTQRPVTRSFNVFVDLRLNKRWRKQSWGWWLETLPCPLWRHCNKTPQGEVVVNPGTLLLCVLSLV